MSDPRFQLDRPPVFVCGVQRSGTTLLVRMLSRCPEISFLPQETHIYPLLWKPGGKLPEMSSSQLAAFLLEKCPAVNYGWTTAMDFLEAFTDSLSRLNTPISTASSLLRYFLYFWQSQQGKNLITGEKTPAHIYYAPEILKEFPECKIILMCRDPRAAALSEYIKLENNDRVDRTFQAFNFIVRWATAVSLIRRYERLPNVHFVRYEDLIEAPGPTMHKVCEFAGISFTRDMLDIGVTNSSFSDKMQKGIGFNIANLTRWKTDLAPAATGMIEHYLAADMQSMGYEISDVSPGKKRLKQSAMMWAARRAALLSPSRFHHYNRNHKYRF